jgi:hypothetical protein
MEQDLEKRWTRHCHDMAHATYTIAERCEDADMLGRYLELAARWMRLADTADAPPQGELRAAVRG